MEVGQGPIGGCSAIGKKIMNIHATVLELKYADKRTDITNWSSRLSLYALRTQDE
jgi:hypothetical protein